MLRCALLIGALVPGIALASPQDPTEKPLARADLHVTVLDFETDQPISAARVAARQWPATEAFHGTTDDRGRALLEGLLSGRPTEIVLHHAEYAARRVQIPVHAGGGLQVHLLPARILSGRFGPAGNLPAQFVLRAAPGTDTVMALGEEEFRLAVRRDGTFGPVKIGAGSYVIQTDHPQRAERWEWFCDTERVAGTLLFELTSGPGAIRGRVRDETGNPRAGTPVRLRTRGRAHGEAWRTVETDGAGFFAFDAVPFGEWVVQPLRAVDRNFLDTNGLVLHTQSRTTSWGLKHVVIADHAPSASVRFGYDPDAVNVTGVLRQGRAPISGWRIRLENPDTADLWTSDHTRPDGMFEIPGLPPDTEFLITFETAQAQVQGGRLRSGSSEREVHWIEVPPGRLTGQVFVEGTRFSPEEGEILVTPLDEERGTESAWATLAADGTFDVPGLRPGRYRVQFRAPSFRSAVQTFGIETGQAADVDLILWTATAAK